MAFVPKEWKDRLVEFAGRRKLTNVSTGEEMIVDVARNEGTVSQEGDAFSAANMSDLEQRVADEFNNINTNLSSVKNYSTEETVVGTWIDGKPIYRKCYVGTPNLSDTVELTPYIIPNSINCNDIDTLVNVSTHYRDSLNGVIAPFTYYRSANAVTTYDIDSNGIRLFRNGQALYTYVVIVEYTKA